MLVAEYIWIDGTGEWERGKTRIITNDVYGHFRHASSYPSWNFDGSSTGQAEGHDSEVILKPVFVCPDSTRNYDNSYIVLCECYYPDGRPHVTNNRYLAKQIFDRDLDQVPWFGIEQEYSLLESDDNRPLGFPKNGYPEPQGKYYCSAGTDRAFGRKVVEKHLEYCLKAGLKISGVNAEVMPGQWEFQVGPCEGIESGDHLWVARYLLQRASELYNINITLHPKPQKGNWNGAGAHCNFSTLAMREPNGYDHILNAIDKLSLKHKEHLAVYGSNNEERLTGAHETSSMDSFSWGVANRGTSVRVGRDVEKNKCGYFEDRRPSSNMDPYLVTSKIF